MRNYQILITILLFSLLVSTYAQEDDQFVKYHRALTVEISSISTDAASSNYEPYGSLFGGSLLYIKGNGFDQRRSANSVVIGRLYPCTVEFASNSEIRCRTSAATNPDALEKLDISVRVDGKYPAYCVDGTVCQFSYRAYYSPKFETINPGMAAAKSTVHVNGIFKAYSEKDIEVRIGHRLCSSVSHHNHPVSSND
jgi:hypothetical protein